jgi:glycosyltransferase involved in cell wall biosynthesis
LGALSGGKLVGYSILSLIQVQRGGCAKMETFFPMREKPIKVLVSVYACSPDWGSEVGTGWGWVVSLAKYCSLDVIVEKGFQKSIEAKRELVFADRYMPKFHFIDIGEEARKYFWEQGNWNFYKFYKKWQLEACSCAQRLLKDENFDIVHQLGMIGFREPGYLWMLKGNFKFIWGPVGGMGELSWRFLPTLGMTTGIKYLIKNKINHWQSRNLPRVKKALSRADGVLAATEENKKVLKEVHGIEALVLNETGAEMGEIASPRPNRPTGKLRLVWCGVMEGRKALHLGLHAMGVLQERGISVSLDIIGGGHSEKAWRILADKLKLHNCRWHGRVPHLEARKIMSQADVMLLTSIREGTPHVLLEGLEAGLPVVCHDVCGMGTVITDECGRKIPMVSPRKSIAKIAETLIRLNSDRVLLKKLSDGALKRATELSWDNKARQMVGFYEKFLTD